MSDEIKEILDYMKQYVENIYEHDSEPMLNWKDLKKLLDYITNLQTIEREYSSLLSENAELQQENDRLNNIINELEEWLEDNIFNKVGSSVDIAIENHTYCKVLDKLKELKENKYEILWKTNNRKNRT